MNDFTQKLTIQAEALGLPETARGLEVVAAAQERLVEVGRQLEQARLTGSLDEVAELTKRQQSLGQAIDLMTGNQEKATEAKVNFGDALRKVHPLLGEVVSTMSRYGGVAAIAGAAIAAFTAAIRTMREELVAAQASINATAQAMNSIQGRSRESQQNIENIRAGTKIGSFSTPEQSIAAIERANRIRERHGFLDEGAVDQAVALASGAGGSFTDEETARSARMMEIPRMRQSLGITEKTSEANIYWRLKKGLTRHSEELDKTFNLENQQRLLGRALAGPQSTQVGGASLDLQEIIARRAPAGADIDYLTKLAQSFGGLGPLEEYAKNLEMAQSGASPSLHIGMRVKQALGGMGLIDDTQIKATPEHLAILRGAFVEMRQNQKKDARQQPASQAPDVENPLPTTRPNFMPVAPMEPHSSSYNPVTGMPMAAPGPTVVNNHYNSRFIAPFARGQRDAMVNGESRARGMERV